MKDFAEITDSSVQALTDNIGHPSILLKLDGIIKQHCLQLRSALNGKNFEKLTVILQTGGGDIDSAFLITKLLRKHAKQVDIIVPLYAKSAGTLICLSANRILLTEISELGPLDTQILEQRDGDSPDYTSALNGFKALEQVQQHTLETLDIAAKLIVSRGGVKITEAFNLASQFSGQTSGTLYGRLDPSKIGEYARALEIGERYGIMILTRYCGWPLEKAQNTVRYLVKQYPHHGFVIDHDELRLLELNAEYVADDIVPIVDAIGTALLKTETSIVKLYEPNTSKLTLVEHGPTTDSSEPATEGVNERSVQEGNI